MISDDIVTIQHTDAFCTTTTVHDVPVWNDTCEFHSTRCASEGRRSYDCVTELAIEMFRAGCFQQA